MPERRHAGHRPSQPSLRRRLLTFLLVPVLGFLLLDAVIGYFVALAYSNRVHDSDLSDSALTLSEMIGNDALRGELTAQARFLLEYDPDGRNYYTVFSDRHGRLIGNAELSGPEGSVPTDGPPRLYDTALGRKPLRAAVMRVSNRNEAGDVLTITVAESLRDRHMRAREILFLTLPMQALLIMAVLCLVWFGVSHGLRVLEPLTARLSRRGHDLGPIGEEDVPIEILPLTRTIDDLFARMRNMLGLQERFIADAAHQLRTPLAGIQLHVERFEATLDGTQRTEALGHVHRLAARAARTSAQLLALTRTQSPDLPDQDGMAVIDLSTVVPEAVAMRVHQALSLGVDLGYEGIDGACLIRGDALQVQEVIDNLVDNAYHYAGRGCTVTVSLSREVDEFVLAVDDDGPGVADAFLTLLGERFFRVPGGDEDGTGLGLSIVESIAERHAAQVAFLHAASGGLRVEVRFPAVTGKPAETTH
ncbi:two-component system sensor histidine kinase TctE [Luteibacter sp. OK325]|jgi:two-component system sensor histidine kinase TctE|uniref:sensor histidine kinase n=1 Tax=Luteibacter sp. OK325 TaxID=2135670 RepID=UPI000D3C29C9|nr:sensor histidine kinase [Luteibacter sp. OK325]PTR28548.1 two-component system sensor histidine kinase TctE [Luteibacter sp. OK325]